MTANRGVPSSVSASQLKYQQYGATTPAKTKKLAGSQMRKPPVPHTAPMYPKQANSYASSRNGQRPKTAQTKKAQRSY